MSDWFKLRDMFCGMLHYEASPSDKRKQNLKQSLTLMKTCNHPDAQLLSSILTNVYNEPVDISNMLLQHDNLVANTYGILIQYAFYDASPGDVISYCAKSAELNHALSQACLVYQAHMTKSRLTFQEKIKLIESAKQSGDCFAFYVSALLKNDKQEFYRAFDLGWHGAANDIFRFYDCNVIEKIDIAGKKALRGYISLILCYWKERKDLPQTKMEMYYFGKYFSKISVVENQKQNICIEVYQQQNAACKAAIDTFCLCAIRLGIYKDMRNYIAKLVWSTRSEALFIFV